MSEPISVLIADDHAIIREALETAISRASDMTLVGQAETGLEAVALNTRLKPDVILLDLRMPEMDGLQALRAIKKDRPEARVVVLTSFDTEDDIIAALKAGASGYILKGTGEPNCARGNKRGPRRRLPAGSGRHISTRRRCYRPEGQKRGVRSRHRSGVEGARAAGEGPLKPSRW